MNSTPKEKYISVGCVYAMLTIPVTSIQTYPQPVVPVPATVRSVWGFRVGAVRWYTVTIALVGAGGGGLTMGGWGRGWSPTQIHSWTVQRVVGTCWGSSPETVAMCESTETWLCHRQCIHLNFIVIFIFIIYLKFLYNLLKTRKICNQPVEIFWIWNQCDLNLTLK